MADLSEQALAYREHAKRERDEAARATLPLVRARHVVATERWERLAARAEAGVTYREQQQAGGARQAASARVNSWTADEDQQLCARVEAGEAMSLIAAGLGRTLGATKTRLHVLTRRE